MTSLRKLPPFRGALLASLPRIGLAVAVLGFLVAAGGARAVPFVALGALTLGGFALAWAVPPRARAERDGDALVIRHPRARRTWQPLAVLAGWLAFAVLLGWPVRALGPGSASVAAGAALAAILAVFHRETFRVDGVGVVRRSVHGRPGTALAWREVRKVHVAGRHGLLLVGDAGRSLRLAWWLDGIGELAAAILAQAPANALDAAARRTLEAVARAA